MADYSTLKWIAIFFQFTMLSMQIAFHNDIFFIFNMFFLVMFFMMLFFEFQYNENDNQKRKRKNA